MKRFEQCVFFFRGLVKNKLKRASTVMRSFAIFFFFRIFEEYVLGLVETSWRITIILYEVVSIPYAAAASGVIREL